MTAEIEASLRTWATVHCKPDLGNEMLQARQVLLLLDELTRLRKIVSNYDKWLVEELERK